jgi:general secretion pathway protein G
MPRTSACCRHSPERRRRARGFTLLELLVVFALIALASGLAAPAMLRGLEAARERGVAADVQALLEGMPVRAFGQGRALEVDAPALTARLPELPDGWRLSMPQPLRYDANGIAAGGTVLLHAPGKVTARWRVVPLSGRVAREPDA